MVPELKSIMVSILWHQIFYGNMAHKISCWQVPQFISYIANRRGKDWASGSWKLGAPPCHLFVNKWQMQTKAVADPGFPVGGGGVDLVRGDVDPRGSYVSKILHVKMKESGPVGGARAGRGPPPPPRSANAKSILCADYNFAFLIRKNTSNTCEGTWPTHGKATTLAQVKIGHSWKKHIYSIQIYVPRLSLDS